MEDKSHSASPETEIKLPSVRYLDLSVIPEPLLVQVQSNFLIEQDFNLRVEKERKLVDNAPDQADAFVISSEEKHNLLTEPVKYIGGQLRMKEELEKAEGSDPRVKDVLIQMKVLDTPFAISTRNGALVPFSLEKGDKTFRSNPKRNF